MQKAKERYSKEKASVYYLENKEAIKKKSRDWYKNLLKEEKDKIKEQQRKRYQQLIQYKKEAWQNKWVLFLFKIRMSEKILKFGLKFGFKHFIGYKEGEIVKQLCIILPQMTGYITKDDDVLDKYNEIGTRSRRH